MGQTEMANIQACIQACQEALRACQVCAAADIRENQNHCALINLDCADICAATANAMLRDSPHHGDFCALCAHLCRACAAECGKHAAMHRHCAECQAACERCAAECDKHARERHI
ncbi:four-helix bundle copper-binding protein [Massilia sp. MS-15]|uniref:four-helix bundle copper-binding protein n=1 Tax=Massilia sp. MS-15 TaxID=2878200 RepID=UPI001CD72A28|nr:four-helix bundle copper-binding protein [Massilia sp. MS-15]MCA1247974.1 four-helix bundle copper-binding protein [Massilia sp. MS-15]